MLGDGTEVKTLGWETLVEVKDLDELATTEEICTALAGQYKEAGEITAASIKFIRQVYSGTQIAVVSLLAAVAKKAIEVRKVRVRLVVCRVR